MAVLVKECERSVLPERVGDVYSSVSSELIPQPALKSFDWMHESTEATKFEYKSWYGKLWQKFVTVPREMLFRKLLVAEEK